MKKFLNNFELYFSALGLFIMLVITFANVLGRFVLSASWSFTEELVSAMFILVTLLGAAVGAKRSGHLGLSVFTDFIPKKYQKYVVVVQCLTTLIFAALLFYFGYLMVLDELAIGMKTAALGWPEAVFGSFIPIGAFFICVRAIQRAIEVLRQKDDAEITKGGTE